LIIVADAVGEQESLAVYHAYGQYIDRPVFQLKYPNSLGLFYSNVTAKCGLIANSQESILTRLSEKGTKIRKELYDEIEIDGIHYRAKVNHNLKPEHIYHGDDVYDAAYTVQSILEDYIRYLAIYYRTYYECNNLVFTGGVAHNGLLKRRLMGMFDEVWVPKDPGDSGSALGAILQHTRQRVKMYA
jgi:carbamoyltransferase